MCGLEMQTTRERIVMPSSTTESTLALVMTAGEEFPSNAGLAQAIKARIPNIVIPVIKDGDTIGPDAATKIVVRHETSGFIPGQPVYRLHFQGKGGA